MERKKILLIDDNTSRRSMLSLFLSEVPAELEIIEAPNLEEAKGLLEGKNVDLVISELNFGKGKKLSPPPLLAQQINEITNKGSIFPLILYTALYNESLFQKEIRDSHELSIILKVEDHVEEFLAAVIRALALTDIDESDQQAPV